MFLQGECKLKHCPSNRIFLESDKLCHRVDEPGFCETEQRMYMTAWGKIVCDCYDGSFKGRDGHCHMLYTPGYCIEGKVLQIDNVTEELNCLLDPCKEQNSNRSKQTLPFVQHENNRCYQWGTVSRLQIRLMKEFLK